MSNSPADILGALQSGVIAINNVFQLLNIVSTTSSGVITIRLTQVST